MGCGCERTRTMSPCKLVFFTVLLHSILLDTQAAQVDTSVEQDVFHGTGINGSVVPSMSSEQINEVVRISLSERGEYQLLVNHLMTGSRSGCEKDGETACLTDALGLEAIKQLHVLMDDDRDGSLDRSESNEFFRDELKHEDGAARQARFHGTDDLISINDLWKLWTVSAVYNWTVNDVILWLEEEASLPQYSESFRVNEVDGRILPRIAVNSQYVISILGIKNVVHRQKLSIKATDLVLFGHKKRPHNWIKDVLLVCMCIVVLALAYWARRERRRSHNHIGRVMAELESLQHSEDTFKQLQTRYEDTQKKHQETTKAKQNLEQKLEQKLDEFQNAKTEANKLRQAREVTEEEISRLKLAELELIEVHKALAESERRCEELSLDLPQLTDLQHWLQLTYEIETQFYDMKREIAERHLRAAREMCERIRKKRAGLFGPLRVAHSNSLDDTDHSIMQARGALEEVRLHLQERSQRWREIEKICGFDIINNMGLHVLETTLRGVGSTFLAGNSGSMGRSPSVSTFSSVPGLVDGDIDDDLTPSQLATALEALNSSSFPDYPDRRVWPNLMKAGMQLTMFGLGLTNPQLGGGAQSISPTDQPERRRTLVDALGSRGLGRQSRTVPGPLYRSDTTGSGGSGTSGEVSDDVTSNGSLVTATRGGNSPTTDGVLFSLGDPSASPSLPRAAPNGTSKTLESADVVRPKKLVTSHSAGSLPGVTNRHSANVQGSRARTLDNKVIREESSESSSENLSDGKDKKKTLKSLFKPKKKKVPTATLR